MGNKFNNVRTRGYDSKKEYARAIVLKSLDRAGKVSDLKEQVPFVLQERFKHEGKYIRAITYVADFTYVRDGVKYIEDVKGFKTEVYKMKKKMLLKLISEGVYDGKFVET